MYMICILYCNDFHFFLTRVFLLIIYSKSIGDHWENMIQAPKRNRRNTQE